jgi:hypothetical protein
VTVFHQSLEAALIHYELRGGKLQYVALRHGYRSTIYNGKGTFTAVVICLADFRGRVGRKTRQEVNGVKPVVPGRLLRGEAGKDCHQWRRTDLHCIWRFERCWRWDAAPESDAGSREPHRPENRSPFLSLATRSTSL